MTQSQKADPALPAKVTEATFEPVDQRPPDRGQFWDDGDDHDHRTLRPMSFSGRMFNVGWKGWVRLALVCVFIGAIFQAGAFNPFAPGFTIGAGLGQIVNGVLNIAAWAAQLGAMPLVLGALVVVPFWLLWRSLVTLFNKDRPPGPHDRILPKEKPKKQKL
jgi:hypothetical protein